MKIRTLRKRAHIRMHRSRAFMISVRKLINEVHEFYDRFDKHLQMAIGNTDAFTVDRKGQTVVTTRQGTTVFGVRPTRPL